MDISHKFQRYIKFHEDFMFKIKVSRMFQPKCGIGFNSFQKSFREVSSGFLEVSKGFKQVSNISNLFKQVSSGFHQSFERNFTFSMEKI